MAQRVRLFGILAMIFGAIACIFTFIYTFYWPAISVISGFLGFLFSTIYTMLNTKHEVNTRPFNPGIIGLALSSTPIITFFIKIYT